MQVSYFTYDVFTRNQFGGNPLAVIPDARDLNSEQMQRIAAEFNYSETTFVLPPKNPQNTALVRIFTPVREMPFAGHPNIGTAITLVEQVATFSNVQTLQLEQQAGLVPITIQRQDNLSHYAELKAPEQFQQQPPLGDPADLTLLADALNLGRHDIATENHHPLNASVGLEFHFVELRDVTALSKAQINLHHWNEYRQRTDCPTVHLYTRNSSGPYDIQCRMFTTRGALREDPATGSANCALAALLTSLSSTTTDGSFSYRIAQGVEMGRPSELWARVEKQQGSIESVFIGGYAIPIMQVALSLI